MNGHTKKLKKITAKQIYEYVNGSPSLSGGDSKEVKTGFSMGSLNAYHSMYVHIHEETLDLIVSMDRDLGSVLIPIEARRKSWVQYMGPIAAFPDE